MTRVTNFGRKRTFLEAGFAEPAATATEPQPAPASDVPQVDAPTTGDVATTVDSGEPPKKKKRIRGKKRKPTVEGAEGASGSAPAKAEEAGGEKAEGAVGGEAAADGGIKPPPLNDGPRARKEKAFKKKKEFVHPSEKRRLERIAQRNAETTCFSCREKGHAARDCPKTSSAPHADEVQVTGICYRCGSSKHNLSKCRKQANPENPLPFASCFVCSGKGHLAGACPQNKTGVYPNGGCCKICRDTSHLAKDCTIRRNDLTSKTAIGTGRDVGADEDDFMMMTRKSKQVEKEEMAEERLKRLLEVAEHAPTRTGMPRVANPLAPKTKKVVVF